MSAGLRHCAVCEQDSDEVAQVNLSVVGDRNVVAVYVCDECQRAVPADKGLLELARVGVIGWLKRRLGGGQ